MQSLTDVATNGTSAMLVVNLCISDYLEDAFWNGFNHVRYGYYGQLSSKFLIKNFMIDSKIFSAKNIFIRIATLHWSNMPFKMTHLICRNKLVLSYTISGNTSMTILHFWRDAPSASITETLLPGTVETLYNTINFCWNTHKRHSIARPKGRGMECLLWVQRATYCVDLSILSSIKYLL